MNLDILKVLAEIGAFVFVLGGIWRDVRATQKDVKFLKSALARDRSLLIQIIRQHNQNHSDNIDIPATNGSEV